MEKNITDNRDIREIDEMIFGIYSNEEIKRLAVCEVNSSKLCGSDKNTGYGTVYDPRMGTIENGIICPTCNQNIWQCVGHFGYISLNEPIVHPLHYKRVVDFLRCFCIKCFKLLITEDQIILNNFNRILGVKRFNKILDKIEKIDMCPHCIQPQPDIRYTATDNSIAMVYKQKDKEKSKISIVLPVDEIKNIFDNINTEDVKLLGFNPELMQPKNLILTIFPCIPTSCRPYVISENNICDDDLTIQLVEIIKANNHLKIEDGVPVSETKRQKYIQSLKFRIATFYNNSSGKAKHSTNGRVIKGLKERLTGKDGLIRTNLMGKRVEQSGRTVIGPDPTLRMGQLSVPPEMASNLTIPVQVTDYNIGYLTQIVNNGKANYVLKDNGNTRINLEHKLFHRGTSLNHGDIIIRVNHITKKEHEIIVNNGKTVIQPGDKLKRNGEFITDIKYPEKRVYQLTVGDVVERQLIDGDFILLNPVKIL